MGHAGGGGGSDGGGGDGGGGESGTGGGGHSILGGGGRGTSGVHKLHFISSLDVVVTVVDVAKGNARSKVKPASSICMGYTIAIFGTLRSKEKKKNPNKSLETKVN